jgi:hypothetical protein
MQPNSFRWAALLLAGVAQLAAQVGPPVEDESAVPKILMVTQEQIKEGREAAHTRAEEAWPRIFLKGNVTIHYIGMTSASGPSAAWFLEPYDSFGAMEKMRAEVMRSLAGDLETANVQDGELRTGSQTLLTVFRGDLSYRASEAVTSMAKCRYMGVTVLRIRNGRDADLAQLARLLIDGDQKSNSDQAVLTYQLVSGGPSGEYLIFEPMESLARMDAVPARMAASRQAMGDRAQKHFDMLAPEVIESTENLLFAFEPRMSYVSKEFAAGDPEFWNPKPSVKPAARGKSAAKPAGAIRTGQNR